MSLNKDDKFEPVEKTLNLALRRCEADLYKIFSEDNDEILMAQLDEIIIASGAHIEGSVKKYFKPNGASLVYLLSESHFGIHVTPEVGYVTCNLSTCGDIEPLRILPPIIEWLLPDMITGAYQAFNPFHHKRIPDTIEGFEDLLEISVPRDYLFVANKIHSALLVIDCYVFQIEKRAEE